MAKRKGSATITRHRAGGDSIVVVEPPRQSAPIEKAGKRRGRRRGGAGGGFGRSAKGNRLIGIGIGGLAYGFIEKSFPSMPTLPIVGKSGTVAIAVYFMGGNNDLINDIGMAAAAIAGYSLGKEGVISGDYRSDTRHGLAAET
jgi:hypothetical protein